MTAERQKQNLTMLSIENLYKQSQLDTTQKTRPTKKPKMPLHRRQGFRLPLIRSKPVAMYLDEGANLDSQETGFSDNVILSGLKQPATASDTALDTPFKLQTTTRRQPHSKTENSTNIKSKHKPVQTALPTARNEDISEGSEHPIDPFNAIKEAVLSAKISSVTAEKKPLDTAPINEDEIAEERIDKTPRSEKTALENLVSQLSHLIELEVDNRLAEAKYKQLTASEEAENKTARKARNKTTASAKKSAKKATNSKKSQK